MPLEFFGSVLTSSTEEIFSELLGVVVEHLDGEAGVQLDCCGSRLALKIEGQPYEIGIVSELGCAQQISKTMLGLDDDDEALMGEELVDAIGELANMIAGRIKGKLSEEGESVELATPQSLDQENIPGRQLRFQNSEFEFSVYLDAICHTGESNNDCR